MELYDYEYLPRRSQNVHIFDDIVYHKANQYKNRQHYTAQRKQA